MNLKDKIKEVFTANGVENPFEAPVVETVKEKFEDVLLADGTPMQIEPAVEAGASAMVADEAGELVPAPDNSYELSDGRIVIISGGMVESVEEPAIAEEEEAEMSSALTEEAIKKIIKSETTVFANEVEELKKQNATLAAEFSAYKEETAKKEKALFSAIDVLSNEPESKPVVKRSNPLKKENKNIFFK